MKVDSVLIIDVCIHVAITTANDRFGIRFKTSIAGGTLLSRASVAYVSPSLSPRQVALIQGRC